MENEVMKLTRLVITCGGTGGHFFPGLSIAREFQQRNGKVLLLLSGVHAENQQQIAASFGINAIALPKMPNPKKSPLRFIWGLIGGWLISMKKIRQFQAQALLGMGSFATTPAVLAAIILRVPLFLHDGNARIGRANRIFSRFARKVATAFPAVNADACRGQVICTGMPVRPELRKWSSIGKAEAVDALNARFGTEFSADKPVILVTGGSQGAAIFNTVIPAVLRERKEDFQLIHLAGKEKLESAAALYGNHPPVKLLLESCSEMELCLGAADLVFSRSGGSTAAELALFGKSAVLVPYPYAAEGHQLDNALNFASGGAARVIENNLFTEAAVNEVLDDFFRDPGKWAEAGRKMKMLSEPDAAEKMVAEISSALD